MPQDLLHIQYEELGAIAQQFSAQSEFIAQLYDQVRGEAERLRPDWLGEGSDAFFTEMQALINPGFQRLHSAISASAHTTSEVLVLMQQAEQEAAGLFHGEHSASGVAGAEENGGTEGSAGGGISGMLGSMMSAARTTVTQGINDLAKARLTDIIRGAGNNSAEAIAYVDGLAPDVQQAIWSDRTLMDAVRDDMDSNDYLNFLVAARVNESGSVSHTSAADADAAIRDHLSQYLDGAIADDRKISGQVAVVGDADWEVAGVHRYGEDLWNSTKRDGLNGFVDGEGRVWIHADRGNPTTMIHEATHKYSDDAMIHVSQPLNEGVTEYFARDTASSLGLPDRTNYQGNYTYASALGTLVGEDVMADAFFNGNMDGMHDAYINTGHSEADWTTMIEHTQKNEWADAELLAAPTSP